MARQNSLLPLDQPAEPDLLPAPARNLTNTDIQRLCGRYGPRSNSSTGTHRCSGSPPGRSAGGCRPPPRLRGSVMASPATAVAWAMAQDLVKSGVELPALMTAGRWKSSKMPARYTERQAAGRGAVARYYQESGG